MNKIKVTTGFFILLSTSASFSAYGACSSIQERDEAIRYTNKKVNEIKNRYGSLARQKTVGNVTKCGHTLEMIGFFPYPESQKPVNKPFESIVDSGRNVGFDQGVNDFIKLLEAPVPEPEQPEQPEQPQTGGNNNENNSHAEFRSLAIQSRQITRQITSTIARRLSANISSTFFEEEVENKMGASSDSSSEVDFWMTSNISQISEDDGENIHIDNDIYQFIGGVDKKHGNLFFGSALTYAYSENEKVNSDYLSNTVGITPYIAYKLTDFMFVSALAGYNYTGAIAPGLDTDQHEYYTEANLTAFKEINSFVIKGRAGIRYDHSFASIKKESDHSFDELILIGDLEIGYRFTEKLKAYTGVLFEHYDRESSQNDSVYHDGVVFMRWGADYQVSNQLSIGAIIETDLNDKSTSLVSGGININLEF